MATKLYEVMAMEEIKEAYDNKSDEVYVYDCFSQYDQTNVDTFVKILKEKGYKVWYGDTPMYGWTHYITNIQKSYSK